MPCRVTAPHKGSKGQISPDSTITTVRFAGDLMYHFGRCIARDTSTTSRIHQEKLMYLDVIGTTPVLTLDVLIHQLFTVFGVLM